VSAIPPIEPIGRSQNTRLVRRRTPEDDQESHGHSEQPNEQFGSDEHDGEDDDGGLPHVDIRV
jgi:hypothetical protein